MIAKAIGCRSPIPRPMKRGGSIRASSRRRRPPPNSGKPGRIQLLARPHLPGEIGQGCALDDQLNAEQDAEDHLRAQWHVRPKIETEQNANDTAREQPCPTWERPDV